MRHILDVKGGINYTYTSLPIKKSRKFFQAAALFFFIASLFITTYIVTTTHLHHPRYVIPSHFKSDLILDDREMNIRSERGDSFKGERYIFYSSHSQFNNQRDSLENGILSAILMNASLVLPYGMLGKPFRNSFPFKPFPILYAKTRVWEDFCENIAPQPYLDRRHAYDQFIETYGNVSCTTFPSLINLQILKNTFPSLRILDNDEFLLEIGMEKELKRTRKDGQYRNWTNIWISLEDKYDVLYIMDQTLTSYQLYSASTFQNLSNFYSIIKTDHERGRKYTSLIDLAQFQSHVSAYNFFVQPPDSVDCGVEYNILTTSTANHDSKYKDTNGLPLLIRFGSIFGSNRVLLSPTQQWIRAKVREAMILKKEGIIERVAVRIIDKIGGIGGYYGVHVRITEGLFYKDAITNIQEITKTLKECITYPETKHCGLLIKPPSNLIASTLPTPPRTCIANIKSNTTTTVTTRTFTIFLATDYQGSDPSSDPILSIIYKEFPCIYTLSDFKEEMNEFMNGEHKYDDKKERFSISHNPKHYIPFVDQVVASRGKLFVGTRKSTFSKYIDTLHEAVARE